MTLFGRCVLLLLAVGGAGCHSHGELLTGRDGGPDAVGTGGAAGAIGGAGGTNLGVGSAFPNGIGPEWKWKTGVVAHTAGPYAPCGIIGSGDIIFGAANPTAPELAAASRAGVVLFYSTETGKQLRAPYYAKGPVNGVDYSRDGTKLVVATDTGVQIVGLADGAVLFSGQPFGLSAHAAALSPDGTLIAALGYDGNADRNSFTLKLVRVSDGTSIAQFTPVAPDGVAPQFSADGKLLAVGGFVLSVPGLAVVPPSPLSFAHVAPTHAALSPDGTKVAEGGHVIDLASGRELKTPILSDGLGVIWSAFSNDGAIYAEIDTSIHLWRTSDWTPIGTPTPVAVVQGISGFGPDGRFFLSGDGKRLIATLPPGSVDGSDHVLFQIMSVPDLTAGPAVTEPQFGYSPAAFSPDGSLIMGVLSFAAGVWRTSDSLPLPPRLPQPSPPYGFLGNGMLLMYDSIFNPLDGTKLGSAIGSAVSPDGRLAVVEVSFSKWLVVRLADLTTQAVLESSGLTGPALGPVWAFSRDNRVVAEAAQDANGNPKVIVFDATKGTVLATLAGAPPIAIATTSSGAVRVAAFVPVANGRVSDVRVWSVPDGKPLFDIAQATSKDWPPDGNLPTMGFSPDGSLIAAGAAGIRIFQVETGALRETLPTHFDPQISGNYSGVLSLAFSASGQIASVGWEGTMRFWCSP